MNKRCDMVDCVLYKEKEAEMKHVCTWCSRFKPKDKYEQVKGYYIGWLDEDGYEMDNPSYKREFIKAEDLAMVVNLNQTINTKTISFQETEEKFGVVSGFVVLNQNNEEIYRGKFDRCMFIAEDTEVDFLEYGLKLNDIFLDNVTNELYACKVKNSIVNFFISNCTARDTDKEFLNTIKYFKEDEINHDVYEIIKSIH